MSVGMKPFDMLLRVTLPAALIAAVPPIVNMLIVLSKETVVLSIITVPELMYQMQTMAAETFTAFDAIFAMAAFYWLLVEGVSRLGRRAGSARHRLHGRGSEAGVSEAMIEIRALHKRFGAHEVLCGVDLTVGHSEVVCLIGPSGSGKSTLLRCVNFLESYDAGEVRIAGKLIGYEDAPDGTRRPMGARASARNAARDRHGVPAFQSVAAHERAAQRRRAAAPRARPGGERGGRSRARRC